MNVSPFATRLPPVAMLGVGADPLAAAQRAGAPLDRADEEARTDDAQARADQSLEDEMVAKARQVAADKQAKEFELNVRRADIVNCAARARAHDGRKFCSPHDASVMWQMEQLLHSMAGGKAVQSDATFDDPDMSRPINSAVDRALRGETSFNGDFLAALSALRKTIAEVRDLQATVVASTKVVPTDHDPDV